MLRGLRSNEKTENENRHCRNKTNANKLIIAQRFTSISLSHVMIKWRYRHCLHHFYYISISILRRFLWQVNKIKINKYSNLRGIPPNKSRPAIWNQSETPTRSGWWHVITMEFLRSFSLTSFRRETPGSNVGCLFSLWNQTTQAIMTFWIKTVNNIACSSLKLYDT